MRLKISFIFVILVAMGYLCLNPIVVYGSQDVSANPKVYKKGDIIHLFEGIDFNEEGYAAYLVLNERFDLPKEMPPGKMFKSDDIGLLKRMKSDLTFTCTGGDMATIENQILLYKGDTLIFEAAVVADKKVQGLQSREFGWARNNSGQRLSGYLSEFNRIYTPLVILK